MFEIFFILMDIVMTCQKLFSLSTSNLIKHIFFIQEQGGRAFGFFIMALFALFSPFLGGHFVFHNARLHMGFITMLTTTCI
jgi:hypothetical protein